MGRHHYHVYVIELSKDVLYKGRFKKANPDYVTGKPCVYVGMTGLDPDLRFDKHKAGIQSNRYVFEFGLRLLPELYEVYNPMPYDGARDMEVELAIGLREAGYGRRDFSLKRAGLSDTMRALQNRRVAQLVRALGRHPRGRWFESNRAYQ